MMLTQSCSLHMLDIGIYMKVVFVDEWMIQVWCLLIEVTKKTVEITPTTIMNPKTKPWLLNRSNRDPVAAPPPPPTYPEANDGDLHRP
ncbi:hypothetical protein ACOSQ2_004489 [Xanthoceras sorbifolium]